MDEAWTYMIWPFIREGDFLVLSILPLGWKEYRSC
jgi:hypothetical protein